MAIKIVEDKPDPKVVKQVVCSQCGVKLEYVPVDVQESNEYDHGGGCDRVRWIECPKCKNHVTVGRC